MGRIGSIQCKRKAKFFTLYDVIFLARLQGRLVTLGSERVNPFTPKSAQLQISPAASPEILHHTVWRTWLFIAYSDERWLYYQFSLHNLYVSFIEGWENLLFELGSEGLKSSSQDWRKVVGWGGCLYLSDTRFESLKARLHMRFFMRFRCDFASKPATAYPARVCSRVTLRQNTAKLAEIRKKGVLK